jgi:hypothetical protein
VPLRDQDHSRLTVSWKARISVHTDHAVRLGSWNYDIRLLGPGVAFIAASIVGGGVSAMGVQIPVIGSSVARWLLFAIGIALTVGSFVLPGLSSKANTLQLSREVAAAISARVQWPEPKVRKTDRLKDDEMWWVVYVQNDGKEAVHELMATVRNADGDEFTVDWGALTPGAREWYILRPDTGISPSGDPPEVTLTFKARGFIWNSNKGQLELLQEPGSSK